MNRKQLLKLIEEGENLNVEFKQRFSEHEKIAKEIIAFANTSGGVIIFGINDNGKIYGVQSEKEVTELLKETITNYCEPVPIYKVSYLDINNSEIVVLEVTESINKPHRIQDFKSILELNTAQVYIRVNDKSVPASKEMIKLLQTRSTEAKLKNYSIGKNEKIVFAGDLIPGAPWVHLPITMGYDRYPEKLIEEKQDLYQRMSEKNLKIFFTHDSKNSMGSLTKNDKGNYIVTDEVEKIVRLAVQ